MTTYANLVPSYVRLRQLGIELNHKLIRTLSKEALLEGGRRLGILQGETLVFDSEDMSSVLMDYCIYDYYSNGKNAVQRFLEESPPPAECAEMAILQAMLKAYYAILKVTDLEPGVGAHALDLLRDETIFLVDINLSHSLKRDAVMAGRVIPQGDFFMTGGAGLPVSDTALPRISRELQRMFGPAPDFSRMTPDQGADLAALVIRTCLASGAAEYIAYGAVGENGPEGRRPLESRTRYRANRNDPCPCGSGRKYRSCCGRR